MANLKKNAEMTAIWLMVMVMSVTASNMTAEQRRTDQVATTGGLWSRVLGLASNHTGRVSRDVVTEAVIGQLFRDVVKVGLQKGRTLAGIRLDPAWVWPLGPIKLKQSHLFKGSIEACDLYLHNLKSILLRNVEVQRDAALEFIAVRLQLRIPIMWMTGYYKLTRSRIFGFLPTHGRGNFNVDMTDVDVGIVATLKMTTDADSGSRVTLDVFEIGALWKKTGIKLEGLQKGFNHLTDWTLNQLGLGDIFAKMQRDTIIVQVEDYVRGVFDCLMSQAARDIEICLRQYWADKGWPWPWVYPDCYA